MHNEFYSFLVSVFVQSRQVEVRVGRDEVENIIFLLAVPVFPADVPAFDEQSVEAVFCSEIYVSAHVFIVGGMTAMWFGVFIVGFA